jgi:AbrB family transcriptional regulator (stage V sporulation protein T)
LKATGIVRRIDDLGRVVIPKEIRRTLRIREGDPLEIFTDREGEIILKKYSPIGELGAFAKEYTESITQSSGHISCIIDRDRIIAISGVPSKKDFIEKKISSPLEKVIEQRTLFSTSRDNDNFTPLMEHENEDLYNNILVAPIISEGDILGGVIILTLNKKINETEEKLAQTAAIFLGKQMEQ